MKEVIPICLSELVTKRFGAEPWGRLLETAGLPKTAYFLPAQDVPDATVMKVIQAACSVLGLQPMAAAEAFGEYCCEYAPRIYAAYYRGPQNAREFLLRMKEVHEKVTRTVPNAHPPVFSYEQQAPRKLVMKYSSGRGLGDIFVGLVKGVGRYFKEELQVRRIGPGTVEVSFAR